jgi:hypothetical protein
MNNHFAEPECVGVDRSRASGNVAPVDPLTKAGNTNAIGIIAEALVLIILNVGEENSVIRWPVSRQNVNVPRRKSTGPVQRDIIRQTSAVISQGRHLAGR